MSANQAVVWFSLAALVLAALWLAGLVNTILLAVGYAAMATVLIAYLRSGRVPRPAARSIVFHLVAVLAIGAHLALAIGYALFAVMGAPQAGAGDRTLLAVVTALVWLAIFGLGVTLWLRRQWLIAVVPVLAVAAVVALGAYAQALPAVPPPEPHSPTLVGVIADLEYLGEGTRMGRLTLESGQTVTVHLDRDERGGRGPQTGDLLLLGQESGNPWYYALPGSDDCFTLSDDDPGNLLGRDAPIRFSFGLTLPKADAYDTSSLGPPYNASFVRFCINRRGEIMSASR